MTDLLINIDVDDLDRAIAFYTTGLGLRLSRRLGSRIGELQGASSPLYLVVHADGSKPFDGATSPRRYSRHWTPTHLDFVVPELRPAIERAQAAGATFEAPIREFGWGRYALMSDPFGNGFCLLQFKGRGYAELEEDFET